MYIKRNTHFNCDANVRIYTHQIYSYIKSRKEFSFMKGSNDSHTRTYILVGGGIYIARRLWTKSYLNVGTRIV